MESGVIGFDAVAQPGQKTLREAEGAALENVGALALEKEAGEEGIAMGRRRRRRRRRNTWRPFCLT